MTNTAEFIDQRIASVCCYCGDSNPFTVDHIPAKVFLDEPYPSQLPTVKACAKCNEEASMDEEFVACFLEALACGSTNDEMLERKKIVSSLRHAPGLRKKIQHSLHFEETPCYADMSEFFSRYRKVVEKNAIGFSRWYGGIVAKPENVQVFLLDQLPAKVLDQFNTVGKLHHEVFPEVASRLLHIITETNSTAVKWEIFQQKRFRVAVWQRAQGIEIRMVFREIAGAVVFCTEFPAGYEMRDYDNKIAMATEPSVAVDTEKVDFRGKEDALDESKEKTDERAEKSREKGREKIVVAIKENPNVTMAELARATGLSAKGVEKNIRILREENVIHRIGPDKGGHWEVIES